MHLPCCFAVFVPTGTLLSAARNKINLPLKESPASGGAGGHRCPNGDDHANLQINVKP